MLDCGLHFQKVMVCLRSILHLAVFLPAMLAWPSFASQPSAASSTPAPSRADALAFINAIKEQNFARLKDTDAAISKKLDESPKAQFFASVEADLEKLRKERHELVMRAEFLDRLTLKVDVGYAGSNLKEFLKGALRSMARIDLESNSDHGIWKFLNNLSLLIDQVPERQQNVLSVVEGYMKQTSIENPMRPDEFLANTAYSNGAQAESAKPMDRAVVGEYAEKQLKETKVQPSPTPPEQKTKP